MFDRYSFIKADISNSKRLRQIMDGCDAVINFAAETHVDRSIATPKPFLVSNTIGTFSLLEAERKLEEPIKHVQISTDEVYGSLGDEGMFVESTPLSPNSPYSASKTAADHLVKAFG